MANNNGKSSLFIGDLAIFCSEREIEEVFSPYGEIQEIKIMRSEETSRNLSYGFIKYSSAQAAKRAMTELNGVILCGRPLRIRWATYKSKLGSKEPKQDVLETSPVHVSFISYQIDKLVTEESLRELFSKYGLVVDASIKKSMIDTDVRRQSGYGFVHYSITGEGIHAAIRAASSLDDITVESVNYKCSLSHNLNKYLTGELSMPAEDSQIPGMPPSHQGQGQGQGQGGYQEDLGLADSDQFFHSPPQAQQSLYNVPMPPPGAGPHLYGNRPNQGPGQGQGQYQSQYGNQGGLYQQQQTGPKYVSQVPLAARNRPPVVPQHGQGQQGHGQGGQGGRPRSMNGYQDLQNQLQQQQQQGGQYDPYDSMYDTRGDQQQQQYGRYDNNNSNQNHYKQQQGGQGQYGRQQYNAYDQHDRDMHSNTNNNANQQLQGVFARGSLAQQRSSNNANPNSNPNTNNLLSAAVSGAYQQNRNSSVGGGVGGGNGYSVERPLPSGPPNSQQGQLRSGVAPYTANSTGSVGASPRVVSAPSLMAASGQSGANSTTNRWSTGSYNVVPPAAVSGANSHNSSSSNLRAPGINNANNTNSSSMSGKPVGKYGMQGSNYPNNTNTNTNNAGYQQQYYNQYDNNNNNTNYDLNANFNNMNMQQYGNVFQMSTPMYNTNMTNMSNMGNMMHGNINLSPPPSPLIPNATFVASPLMGNATLFNPFQQGFSPLFATVQGQLSPYVAAAQMSPLMSPGMIPRDVVFEENISNVHNLFTPATYYASPVMALRDAHYSPAMFQGNFTTANAYPNSGANPNNGGNGMQQGQVQGQGQGQGQGFDVRQYSNQRKAAQKTFPSTNTAHNNTNNTTTSPNATNTTAHAVNSTADTTSAEPHSTEEAFFSSAAQGSPLEPECAVDTPTCIEDSTSASGVENASDGERESEGGEVFASEIDCSDAATATTSETPLGSNSSSGESLGAPPGMSTANSAGGAGTESPNKALGSARRSMIMKHAKQLVA